MDFLKEWITNIIIFVLLATVIDMLLPNSTMQKYTKMVTGLLLIALILSPILKFINSDVEATIGNMSVSSNEIQLENSIDLKKKEIQASLDAYALQEVAGKLEEQVEEELMDKYELKIASIHLSVDEESTETFPSNLQSISVQLQTAKENTVEAIQPVEIDTGEELPDQKTNVESDEIASLLSERWDVSETAIEIVIEGGDS